MRWMTSTKMVHLMLSQVLKPGDLAWDATAGNGHDTLFLAQSVGETGVVWACDVQASALQATEARLKASGIGTRVHLQLAGHETADAWMPEHSRGALGAVVFNLGYLPGGDHEKFTRRESTLSALNMAVRWLRVGGSLMVTCYQGHEGGLEETQAVTQWLEENPLFQSRTSDAPRYQIAWWRPWTTQRLPPVVLVICRES